MTTPNTREQLNHIT